MSDFNLLPYLGQMTMVLGGPWTQEDDARKERVVVHFQTFTLVPSPSDPERSRQMLMDAGLAFTTLILVRAPPTHIDVEYIDDTMRVHRAASGAVYILSRQPFGFRTRAEKTLA